MRQGIQLIKRRHLALLLIVVAGVLLAQRAFVLGTARREAASQGSCQAPDITAEQVAARQQISVDTVRQLQAHFNISLQAICALSPANLAQAQLEATPVALAPGLNRDGMAAAEAEREREEAEARERAEQGERPDQPDKALEYRLRQLRDERGQVPRGGWRKAKEFVKAKRDAGMNVAGAGIAAAASWTWLGPGNIGGRTRSLVIHPTTPQVMWAGSVGGGIWKTTTGGTSWFPLNDFMANIAVSSLAIDPSNPDVLYAGTGEGFGNIDSLKGDGIFKTTDGGTTWTQLGFTTHPGFDVVNRLAVSSNGQTLFAATSGGIWRSTNAGATWNRALEDNVLDLRMNPQDSTKVVASGNGKAWYWNNLSQQWVQATGFLATAARIELAYAASNPSIVFASVRDAPEGGSHTRQLWKSVNGGQSYSQVTSDLWTLFGDGQGWYNNTIWVDPVNPQNIVIGAVDLYRSVNGGLNFTRISDWGAAPASAHADQHTIVHHPGYNGTTNKTVFFGNDGGVYKAADVLSVAQFSGWQELNNNYGVTQFYGGAGSVASGKLVGGTQDNGTLLYAGDTEGWTTIFGGDGGYSAADPADGNYLYGEYTGLQIHRNTTGGTSGSNYIIGNLMDAGIYANFIAPFILDPNNANRLLAGGRSLWRTDNAKSTGTVSWQNIKPVSSGDNYISAIAVAPGNSNIIWVGHNNGDIYKTVEGNLTSPSWVKVDDGANTLPNRGVTRLTVDPHDPTRNTIYATFGGFVSENVWKSTDGGWTWSDATGTGLAGLPDVPVLSLVVHPQHPGWLYVGTEVGVFTSQDDGRTWGTSNDGPANVSVQELFWMGPDLVAVTHGRGMFKTRPTVPAATRTPSPTPATGANLAQGKTASADSICVSGEGAVKAVDGLTSTKWCSQGANKWLEVDLGAAANLTMLRVKHAGAGGELAALNTRDFNIQLSTNRTDWTTPVNITGNVQNETTHWIATTRARYVRLNIAVPSSNGDGAARIYELEAYGSGSTSTPTPTSTPTASPPLGTNIGLNKSAMSANVCAASEGPEYALDGLVTTKWCAFGSRWLQVDLGSAASITAFRIKHAGAGGELDTWNSREFNIQISADGTQWSTVVNVAGNTERETTHWIPAATGRYVLFNVTNPTSSGDGAARIYEFEIYGTFSNVTPTSTATATRTNTRTNTPSGPTATRTATATRTNTPGGPTATSTRTNTRTNTPSGPTATRTATRTNTPLGATPTRTSTTPPSGLRVQYRAAETLGTTNQPRPYLNIVNGGSAGVALSGLKARYWYTWDGASQTQQYACDWAAIGCGNVTGSFVRLATSRPGADTYLEVGFTSGAGSLAAGAQTGEIQNRFNKSDWSNFTQTGDYSFDPTKTAFADWSKVTLYQSGTLVWGVEP